MAKGFDLDIDLRFGRLRWRWHTWLLEPEADVEPQPRGDVYSSTERANPWGGPNQRMGFSPNLPD